MPPEQDHRARLQFFLLCCSHFLFACSFNMPIPELPDYLIALGGRDYLGLIIALFTLMAGLSRPFSGKLADTVGRIPVMIYGSAVCVVCSLLYPVLTTVGGFLFLRFLHGFSTGFKPTGASAYVADIAPPEQRARAMGTLGLSSSLGFSAGPAAGSYLTDLYGITVMFYLSAFLALVSVIILAGMRETLTQRQPFRWSLLRVSRQEIIEPKVIPPSVVTLLLYAGYGAVLTLVPALSRHAGVENKGLFFTFYTISAVGIRLLAGHAADRYGRVPVLKVAGILMGISMYMILSADTRWALLSAALLYGLSMGLFTPAAAAWAVDLSHPHHRGRALATLFIAMEISIGAGALLSGWCYARLPQTGITLTFAIMSGLAFLAFVYLQWGRTPDPLRGKEVKGER
ncbi:MFS transporter [Compostibacter hankyongensis]|uniref:MFS transporter n=1 Tax=Compostibacter hankyongensis TaxID=1007089 RepID=A0ABP8FCP0_9BACT